MYAIFLVRSLETGGNVGMGGLQCGNVAYHLTRSFGGGGGSMGHADRGCAVKGPHGGAGIARLGKQMGSLFYQNFQAGDTPMKTTLSFWFCN